MKFKTLKLIVALLFVSIQTYASTPAGQPPPPQPAAIPPPVGDPLPIDSSIAVLFASGLLLGAFFKLKKNKISKL